METRAIKAGLLGFSLMVLLLLAACAVRVGDFEIQWGDPERLETGELSREERTVPLEEIDLAQVEIRMGAGQLDLQGGAETLMQAEFTYNVEEWQPEASFEKADRLGTLVVRQPFTGTIVAEKARNEWWVQLSDDVPMPISSNFALARGILI